MLFRSARDSLVILPEMFATGFSMDTARTLDDASRETENFLASLAREHVACVLGGLVSNSTTGKPRNEALALAPDGTLTFTPAPGVNGSALVTVIAEDNGGTANGGVNRATNSFTLTVLALNHAPSFSLNPTVAWQDFRVLGWGRNDAGQTDIPTAAQSGVIAVAGGGTHTLALKRDGTVVAWGDNSFQQTDVPVAAQSGVRAIATHGPTAWRSPPAVPLWHGA